MASSSSNVEKGSSVDQSAGGFDENSANNATPMKTLAYSTAPGKLKMVPKRGTSAFSGVQKSHVDGLCSAYAYVTAIGRSVYLGKFNNEVDAARAHDIVTLRCSGTKGVMNFPPSDYKEIMRWTKDMTADELLSHVRRSGSRFARGNPNFRGVSRYAGNKRYCAYKGKNIKEVGVLGVYDTMEEAAMAHDIESIKVRGWRALTNFNLSLYDVEGIQEGTTKPVISEEAAMILKRATVLSPFGAMLQCVSSGGNSGTPSAGKQCPPAAVGFPYHAPPHGDGRSSSSAGWFHTGICPSHSHTSFNDRGAAADHFAGNHHQWRPVIPINMFYHSSSSPFKPYEKNLIRALESTPCTPKFYQWL